MLRKFLEYLLVPTFALLMAACNGGGGGDAATNTAGAAEDDVINEGDAPSPVTVVPEQPSNDELETDDGLQTNDELQRELEWLYNKMKTEYLFYKDTPDLDYTQFESAEALLEQMIVADKDRFSFIYSLEEEVNASNATGSTFGMRVERSDEVIQVSRVYNGSSADEADIERADRIIRIGDVLILDEDSNDTAWEVASNAATGATIEFEFVRENSPDSFTRALTRTEVSRQTVDVAGFITESDGTRTGYIYIYEFLEKTNDELRNVFQFFRENNITSLIIDLRDNQGGNVETINVLASLILLDQPAGSPFIRYQFSDLGDTIFRNGEFETGYDLTIEPDGAQMDRIHVISSARTCSASEVLINSLRPYRDVQVTGVTTCGKPYGFYGRKFEEKSVLRAINFTSANARGEDDFADGLAPTCEISDYEIYPFADTRDVHLATALNYLKNNSCLFPIASANPDSKDRSGNPAFNLTWQHDQEDNTL